MAQNPYSHMGARPGSFTAQREESWQEGYDTGTAETVDLLAACEEAATWFDFSGKTPQCQRMLKAAIAKHKGES